MILVTRHPVATVTPSSVQETRGVYGNVSNGPFGRLQGSGSTTETTTYKDLR